MAKKPAPKTKPAPKPAPKTKPAPKAAGTDHQVAAKATPTRSARGR